MNHADKTMDGETAEQPAGTSESQDAGERPNGSASKTGGSGTSVNFKNPSKGPPKDEVADPLPAPPQLDTSVVFKTESKVSAASATAAAPARKPSGKASAASAVGSLRTAASIITRISGSLLSGRGNTDFRVQPGSRSAMSMPGTAGTSRVSVASRGSRGTMLSMPVDYGLSPGLQQLIERLANTKDVGLIAYLSAIPGEPLRASKPPAALARLQRKPTARPKSIMKISKPQVRFEPTYRTEPMRPFRADRARALVQSALQMGLAGAAYSEQWATDATRILAAYITQCIKGLDAQAPGGSGGSGGSGRYKIGTAVSVLERNWQGVRTELAVLWDSDRDRVVTASVETTTMVAFAVVYAVYWE